MDVDFVIVYLEEIIILKIKNSTLLLNYFELQWNSDQLKTPLGDANVKATSSSSRQHLNYVAFPLKERSFSVGNSLVNYSAQPGQHEFDQQVA